MPTDKQASAQLNSGDSGKSSLSAKLAYGYRRFVRQPTELESAFSEARHRAGLLSTRMKDSQDEKSGAYRWDSIADERAHEFAEAIEKIRTETNTATFLPSVIQAEYCKDNNAWQSICSTAEWFHNTPSHMNTIEGVKDHARRKKQGDVLKSPKQDGTQPLRVQGVDLYSHI